MADIRRRICRSSCCAHQYCNLCSYSAFMKFRSIVVLCRQTWVIFSSFSASLMSAAKFKFCILIGHGTPAVHLFLSEGPMLRDIHCRKRYTLQVWIHSFLTFSENRETYTNPGEHEKILMRLQWSWIRTYTWIRWTANRIKCIWNIRGKRDLEKSSNAGEEY